MLIFLSRKIKSLSLSPSLTGDADEERRRSIDQFRVDVETATFVGHHHSAQTLSTRYRLSTVDHRNRERTTCVQRQQRNRNFGHSLIARYTRTKRRQWRDLAAVRTEWVPCN